MHCRGTTKSCRNISCFYIMFYIREPLTKNAPWILSDCKETKIISIPTSSMKDIRNHHILGIDFLYRSYKKQLKGAILNEIEDMNMHLQVACFLNAMLSYVEPKFLVLIITPDRHMVNWHYHLTVHGGLRVQIITPKTCPEDFDEEHGLALLLPFSNLKLSEYLVDYKYSCIVIDDFDEVASKLVIRKLHGYFNIGLTQRNFYANPDQKLQWTMLNWSNPGCVGKLADFYQIDNDNFANFRDNYRHWWLRLTWNFCDSLKELTNEEKHEYTRTLSKWSVSNHLTNFRKPEKTVNKRKQIEIVGGDQQVDTCGKKRMKKSDQNKKTPGIVDGVTHEIQADKPAQADEEMEQTKISTESESQSSDTTVIYELEKDTDSDYVELPSMDENPILNSIIKNLEKSPDPIPSQHSAFTCTPPDYNDEPNCSKASEEEDVLLSIIDNRIPADVAVDKDAELNLKKEALRSQIFSDEPCTSKSLPQEEDSEFFQSLIDSNVPMRKKKNARSPKSSKKDDIEMILREAEVLLK